MSSTEGPTAHDEATFPGREGRPVAALFTDRGHAFRAVSSPTDLGRPDGAMRQSRRLEFALGTGADMNVSNATTRAARAGLTRTLDAALPV